MINYSLKKIAEITGGKLIGDENITIKGIQYDSRLSVQGEMFAPMIGERVDGHRFVQGLFEKGIVASFWQENTKEEMPKGNLIVVKDTLTAIYDLAKAYRRDLKCKVIAVTGSSGKTSTKDIIAATLSGKYKTYKTKGNQNNEYGVPMMVMNVDDDAQYAIIECGISDFNEMEPMADLIHPNLTIISSIGPAHIGQFKCLDNTVKEKCKINLFLGDGQAFYNGGAYGLKKELENMHLVNKPISYGFEDEDVHGGEIAGSDDHVEFSCDGIRYRIPLLGKHQVLNSLGAIAIARHEGLNEKEIQDGFNRIQLTPHRLQLLKINDGVVIDDTYNANPASMVASLQTMLEYNPSYHKTVVLGDMLELGENSLQLHGSVADEIDFRQFDRIILVGSEIRGLEARLKEQNINCEHYETIDTIASLLKPELQKEHVLFFKASNGMNFVNIIEQLEEQ